MRRRSEFITVGLMVVLVAGCTGSSGSSATAESSASTAASAEASGSSSASPAASPSSGPTTWPTLSPSPTPVSTPTPEPTAQPTPPAPGKPWGGLVFSKPVKPEMPWGHLPDQILSWHGQQLGIGRTGSADAPGEVVVATSPDLVHWTTLASGKSAPTSGSASPPGTMNGRQVVAGSSQLVAFGYGCGVAPGCPVGGIWTSPDAVTWTSVDASAFEGASFSDAAGGSAGFVAVGSTGTDQPAIWFSQTGSAWSKLTLPTSTFKKAKLSGVGSFAGGFVVLGTIGEAVATGDWPADSNGPAGAWWSTDGLNWNLASMDGTSANPFRLTAAAHGLVASGICGPFDAPGPAVWSSTNGHSWRSLESFAADDSPIPGVPCFYCLEEIATDGNRVIGLYSAASASLGPEAWQTFDGSQWTQLRIFGDSSLSDVAIIFGMVATPQGVLIYGWDENGEPIVVSAAAVP